MSAPQFNQLRTIDDVDELCARDCSGDCYRGHRCGNCAEYYATFDAMPALYDDQDVSMLPGWEFLHTGGNCTALQRTGEAVPGRGYWLLTGDGDAQAPEIRAQYVNLGLYDADDNPVSSLPLPSVDAALAVVALVEGADLVDVITRAISVIEEADPDAAGDPEGHAPLIQELRALIGGGR